LKGAFSACYNASICIASKNLTADVFYRVGDKSHGLFGSADTHYNQKHLDILYHDLQILHSEQGEGHLHIIGLEVVAGGGMLSYPNFNDGQTKALDHPDLIPLAALTEAANIDLRIMILLRNPHDVLYSALSRNFGGTSEAKILIDNASLLNNQISMLDPRYFICIEYEKWKEYTISQLTEIGKFLHPRLDEETMKSMVEQIRSPSLHNNTNDETIEKFSSLHEYTIFRLSLEVEKTKQLCLR
jgi:hypothetical protein